MLITSSGLITQDFGVIKVISLTGSGPYTANLEVG